MKEFMHVLGRLYAVIQKPIEVRQVGFYNPKERTTDYLPSPLGEHTLRLKLMHKQDEDFPVIYLIDALLSRGAHVKDQLLIVPEHRSKFIKMLTDVHAKDRKVRIFCL